MLSELNSSEICKTHRFVCGVAVENVLLSVQVLADSSLIKFRIGGPLELVNFSKLLIFSNLHLYTPRSWSLVLGFLPQGYVQKDISTEMVHGI